MSNRTRRTTGQNLNRKGSKKQPRLTECRGHSNRLADPIKLRDLGLSLLSTGEFGIHRFMDPRESLVALNMIEHVGPVRVRQLLEHFGDAPAVLSASRAQLLQVRGIGADIAESIAAWEKSIDLNGELKRIADFGCHILTP